MKKVFIIALAAFLSTIFFYTPQASGQSGIHVEESKKHFEKGVSFFKKEKFRDALDEFMKSYDLRPHWGILYNIGVCYLKLDKKAKSLMALLEFVEKGGDEISPKTASEVESFIQDLMKEVGVVRFTGDISQARVLVDGEYCPEAVENMYMYVLPGTRYIRIVREGRIVFEDKIKIKKGKEINIDVGGAGQVPPSQGWTEEGKPFFPVVAQPEGPEGPKEEGKAMRIAGWTSVGIAGALFVAYAAAGGVALSERNKMEDVQDEWNASGTCGGETCDRGEALDLRDSHYDKARSAKIAANVLFGLGLAAAATSIGLLVGGYKKKTKKESSLISGARLDVSPGGLSLRLSF